MSRCCRTGFGFLLIRQSMTQKENSISSVWTFLLSSARNLQRAKYLIWSRSKLVCHKLGVQQHSVRRNPRPTSKQRLDTPLRCLVRAAETCVCSMGLVVLHKTATSVCMRVFSFLSQHSTSAHAFFSLTLCFKLLCFALFCSRSQESSPGDMKICRNPACPLSRRRERLCSRRVITGEPPSVFSLGLVWNHWRPALVADLLGMLSPVVDLDVVFSRGSQRTGNPGAGGGTGDFAVGKVRRAKSFG